MQRFPESFVLLCWKHVSDLFAMSEEDEEWHNRRAKEQIMLC